MSTKLLFLVCLLVVSATIGVCQGGKLRKDFYKDTCPKAEEIVQKIIWKRTSTNPNLPAKLLRMHFHDCFVRGCDGSVLLNTTANNTAEKDAIPNLSLAGFDVIEDIKTKLENTCKGIVSCADILALAARDSVSFQFKKAIWKVPTGRRDGKVSIASEVLSNLPAPFSNFTTLKQNYANKGLNVHDLVVLSGGHTLGKGHCFLFSDRLYNFTGRGGQDPSLNPSYANFLKTQCKSPSDTTTTVDMDPNSGTNFDTSYFSILKQKKGMFTSDAALLTNRQSKKIVDELVSPNKFFTEFAQAMEKMGKIGVLTGTAGEIRKKCGVINYY